MTPSGIEPAIFRLVHSGRTPYFKPTKKMHFVGLKYGMLENAGMNNIKLIVAEA
jgi:hypothetical protein